MPKGRTLLGLILIAAVIGGIVVYSKASLKIAASLTSVGRQPQHDSPQQRQLSFEDVVFSPRDANLNLKGWYIPSSGARRTLIFVHGIGDNRTGRARLALARDLVDHGFNILMFDLRAHGESEGEIASGGYYEQDDVLGAIDFLHAKDIPSSCLGVLAGSAGGAAATLALAQEPAIQALILDSTYADIDYVLASEITRAASLSNSIARLLLPGVKLAARLKYGIVLNDLKPEHLVTQLDYPIFIMHGQADTRIPAEQSERIHAAAHPQSTLWLAPDSDHGNLYQDYPLEYVTRTVDYFKNRLTCE